jgi:hypothetical protein
MQKKYRNEISQNQTVEETILEGILKVDKRTDHRESACKSEDDATSIKRSERCKNTQTSRNSFHSLKFTQEVAT